MALVRHSATLPTSWDEFSLLSKCSPIHLKLGITRGGREPTAGGLTGLQSCGAPPGPRPFATGSCPSRRISSNATRISRIPSAEFIIFTFEAKTYQYLMVVRKKDNDDPDQTHGNGEVGLLGWEAGQ